MSLQRVLEYIERGASWDDACSLVPGFESAAVIRQRANNGDEEAVALLEEFLRAEARCAQMHLDSINAQAREGSLKASMFMLQAVRPERFAPKVQGAAQVQVNVLNQASAPTEMEAKERVYEYALKLFREEPKYLERLYQELKLLGV